MLTGQGTYTLDAKKRMALPKEMRAELGDHVFVAPGLDAGTISLFPQEMLDRIKEKIDSSLSFTEAYKLKRKIFPRTFLSPIDQQGRILIPQEILTLAGISTETRLTVEGIGDFAVIWKADEYEKVESEQPSDLGAAFEEAGI